MTRIWGWHKFKILRQTVTALIEGFNGKTRSSMIDINSTFSITGVSGFLLYEVHMHG